MNNISPPAARFALATGHQTVCRHYRRWGAAVTKRNHPVTQVWLKTQRIFNAYREERRNAIR